MKARIIRIGNSQGIRIPRPLLDQLRTVDRTRLVKRLGRIGESTQEEVLSALAERFAP